MKYTVYILYELSTQVQRKFEKSQFEVSTNPSGTVAPPPSQLPKILSQLFLPICFAYAACAWEHVVF